MDLINADIYNGFLQEFYGTVYMFKATHLI